MRLLAKLIASFVIVMFVTLMTLLIVLSTDYGLPLVKKAVRALTPFELKADALDYDLLSPLSVSLSAPSLAQQDDRSVVYQADYLSLTGNLLASLSGTPTLKSAVVRGATLSKALQADLPNGLAINQLALDEVSYQSDNLSFSQADIQLSNWRNSQTPWGEWHGAFQFSAPSITVYGQPLSNLLLDSELKDDKWELWGVSFNSAFGNVTGSATLEGSHWFWHQLTLSDARIEPSENLTRLQATWEAMRDKWDVTFHRLDLLDVSASLKNLTLEHLNLSAQAVNLQQGEISWPDNATASLLSFNASLLNVNDWLLTDVLGELSLSPSRIDIGAFSSKINDEGFVSLSGDVTPTSVALKSLLVNGLTLEADTALADTLTRHWRQFDSIGIEDLSVHHTHLTLPDPAFPLQVVGLNLKGRDLMLRQRGHDGMWQGDLTGSAKTASINRIAVFSPYAAMRVEDGVWRLDPLSLSFQQGQLAAKAEVNLANTSRPWKLEGTGLSLPTSLYQRWLSLNLPLDGEHDVDVRLSGLGSDGDSLSYSLTGALKAVPHRTLMMAKEGQSLSQRLLTLFAEPKNEEALTALPISVGEVAISADRGRVSLSPVSLVQDGKSSTLSGDWDLVTGEGSLNHLSQP